MLVPLLSASTGIILIGSLLSTCGWPALVRRSALHRAAHVVVHAPPSSQLAANQPKPKLAKVVMAPGLLDAMPTRPFSKSPTSQVDIAMPRPVLSLSPELSFLFHRRWRQPSSVKPPFNHHTRLRSCSSTLAQRQHQPAPNKLSSCT